MTGALRRSRREYNQRVEVAWRTANFIGAGSKLPPLSRFTIDVETGAAKKGPIGDQVNPDDGLASWEQVLRAANGES